MYLKTVLKNSPGDSSVCGCKRLVSILNRDRQEAVFSLFQQRLKPNKHSDLHGLVVHAISPKILASRDD